MLEEGGDRKIHKEDRKLKWRSWGGCGKIILEFCLYFDEWKCCFKQIANTSPDYWTHGIGIMLLDRQFSNYL